MIVGTRTMLWLVVFGGTLFFWPACLDRYLAPRFFFLSAALLLSVFGAWKDSRKKADGRWHLFDLLLLSWYAMNLAAVAWSFNWSEGIFYAQKVLLLFGTYWAIRQALLRDEEMARKTLGQITRWLTGIVIAILVVQIGMAADQKGLDNTSLYDFASGVFGNKSLAAEFLFFLLVLNALFVVTRNDIPGRGMPFRDTPKRPFEMHPLAIGAVFGTLFILILVLQVRTAIVATMVGLGLYGILRAILETRFRKIFLQKILPAGVLALGLLLSLLSWKGSESSMAKRLNPLNYLESETARERQFVWYKTDLLNAEHYWLGVGSGSWKFWLPSKNIEGGYRLAEKNVIFTRAHNDYLEIRAEMGMVGVLLFCVLFGVAFLAALLALKKNPAAAQIKGRSNHEALLAGIGLVGYCIIQYFDFPRERIEFQVVLALLFALLAHRTRDSWEKEGGAFVKKITPILLLFMLGGLALNLVIGWERMRGEIHNVRMLNAQSRNNWRGVLAESALAENPFYRYGDTAIPLVWHEGVAWFQLKEYEKSVTALERAYRLNPWSFQVINNYAAAMVKSNRPLEAVPLFEKALSINPRYDEGKFNLALVYLQMADYSASEAWLNRVDTIAGPANDADREKNRATLKQLKDFQRVLEEKRK